MCNALCKYKGVVGELFCYIFYYTECSVLPPPHAHNPSPGIPLHLLVLENLTCVGGFFFFYWVRLNILARESITHTTSFFCHCYLCSTRSLHIHIDIFIYIHRNILFMCVYVYIHVNKSPGETDSSLHPGGGEVGEVAPPVQSCIR